MTEGFEKGLSKRETESQHISALLVTLFWLHIKMGNPHFFLFYLMGEISKQVFIFCESVL